MIYILSIIFLTGQIAKNRTVRSKTGHLATLIENHNKSYWLN